MGIVKIKQVICDSCGCAIDYFDESLNDKEIKEIVKNNGAIVRGNYIFCCKECSNKAKKNIYVYRK